MFYRSGWLRCVVRICIGAGLSWWKVLSVLVIDVRCYIVYYILYYYILYIYIYIYYYYYILYYTLLLYLILYYTLPSSDLSIFPFPFSSIFSSSLPSHLPLQSSHSKGSCREFKTHIYILRFWFERQS